MKQRIALIAALAFGGAAAQGAEFPLAEGQDVIGAPLVVEARYEDTFVSLAREHNVGFEALRRANPAVDAWLPGAGTRIIVPKQYVLPDAPRRGIVVNLPELRLYYFPDGDSGRVITHPISIGRMEWGTPLGRTTVVNKRRNPTWYPPQSIRDEHEARGDPIPGMVPPGPDNPLGNHALYLGLSGYLIHGTNKPSGVGMRVTHGCVRMFPEDIEALFEVVEPGTTVHIVNQPYKLGWAEGGLYLEAHLPLRDESVESVEPGGESTWSPTDLTRLVVATTEDRLVELDWYAAERVMEYARGIPESVSLPVLTVDSDDHSQPSLPAALAN